MKHWPLPGTSRTRAVASLRRPVELRFSVEAFGNGMTSIIGIGLTPIHGAPWLGYGSVREREGLRALRHVRVFPALVDLELLDHGAAQAVLGQHAAYGQEQHAVGLVFAHLAERRPGNAAR